MRWIRLLGVEQIRVAVRALETGRIKVIAWRNPALSSGIGVAQRNVLMATGLDSRDGRHRTDHHQSDQGYEHGYQTRHDAAPNSHGRELTPILKLRCAIPAFVLVSFTAFRPRLWKQDADLSIT